ncbi:HalD/BesD family halogenase [Nocardia nova]|uniref:HalD/BesD family halogenase n=1 Tax=Nocardia nova TaxID=37330 RepID=UPI0018952EFF|nr:hypothetical protein [Nocardia nova]MBF6150231.1 hypothetical protein [Nocardia nova]
MALELLLHGTARQGLAGEDDRLFGRVRARFGLSPSSAELDGVRDELEHRGCAIVTFLFSETARSAVAADAIRLAERAGIRRDLVVNETGGTPRRMRNVTRAQIAAYASEISRLYRSSAVVSALEQVTGERLFQCPYLPEQFVITRLEAVGDTHGWHWDDYSFALVWVAECPSPEEGGVVECVPDTIWDKRSPRIEQLLQEREVHRLEAGPGEVYLMRTNTTLHRVCPLRQGRRTIVNMAFATADDLSRKVSHETMDALWASGTE